MSIIEIRSIYDQILWQGEAKSIRDAFEQAVREGKSLDRASLVGASLVGASLVGASLVGASLVGASLDGARLVGASLDGASLDPIRDDLYSVLDAATMEVAGLLAALREGRVDGSTYSGECACLVGTIANLRHESVECLTIDLRPNSSRPAEVWFLAIRRGDTPANNPIASITVGWVEEWLRKHEQAVPPHVPVYWRGDVKQFAADARAAGIDLAALATQDV